MLDWLKGARSEHPLADEKAAREFIADLPKDSFKALEDIGHWLESLATVEDLKVGRRFEILDGLDHVARGHLRKLQEEYLAGGGRLQRFKENRIWNASTTFWRQLGEAHVALVTAVRSGAAGAGAIKDRMPLIVARGLRATDMGLKWQLMRYGPVNNSTWISFYTLFGYADENGIAAKPVTVYPGNETTCQAEFLKALMLAVSSTDSLLPGKLDVAERLIASVAEHYLIQAKPSKGCHFVFDRQSGKAPGRFVERVETGDRVRFFGPGNAAEALERLADSVRRDGAIPSSIDLVSARDPATVIEVAQHLARYWAQQPPARSEERRHTVSQISVVHGFDEIMQKLGGSETQDLNFEETAETWTVENESVGGYGAVMRQTAGEWLHIGALLGVRLSEGGAWGVGIVRRMNAREDSQLYVGIQLIARGATAVILEATERTRQPQSAVLLPSNATDSLALAEMNLLLRAGSYSSNENMEMRAYDRSYRLMPRELVERGSEFDMARFRVLQSTG